MGSLVIGSLRVDLGLNSAQFATGLKNATKGLGDFSVIAARSFAAVAAGAALAAGAMGVAVKGAIDHADALSKSAQKAGTTVEALSRLEYAAKLSDVSLESLTGGLQKLGKSMADAVATPTSSAATAFKALGIELTNTDGSLRSSDKVMADIADRFSRLEDGSTKTALAMQMFGKSGAEMIPLLNSGADGLKRYADESDRLGATISTGTAKAAEEFNDTLTTIGVTMNGVVNKVMEAALPALQQFADLLASPDFAKAAQSLASGVILALNRILDVIATVINKFNELRSWQEKNGLNWDGRPKVFPLGSQNIEDRTSPGWMNNRSGKGAAGDLLINTSFAQLGDSKTYGSVADMFKAMKPIQVTFAPTDGAEAAAKAMSDQLKGMNGDLELQKQRWEELQQPIRDTVSAVADGLSGALSGMISDLIKGKDAVGGLINAFGSLGDRLIQMAMDNLIQGLLGSLMGGLFGGGGLGVGMGLTGAATYGFTGNGIYGVPGFDGGGFTGYGSRSGGMDGKGGFMAMLHPNETVLDHSKGQDGGLVMTFNITGSRQDAAEIARVTRQAAKDAVLQYQKNPYR